jgi:serine/threonine protein phosphatase PrpC
MAARWQGEGGQHQGGRPYQEDSWTLKPLADGALLAIVADGMGGHAGGAVASKLVVEAFAAAMGRGLSLADGLKEANQAVRKGVSGKADLAGMGSTVIAATVKDDEVHWISVGDSPFYRVNGGKLERLNADHSMAPQIDQLQERGMLSAEEAANHPGRHTLREAVMGEPLTLIDEGRQKMGPGARLLLCSDGVQSLGDDAIAAKSGGGVKDVIAAVLAVGSPHQDNITVIKLERHS